MTTPPTGSSSSASAPERVISAFGNQAIAQLKQVLGGKGGAGKGKDKEDAETSSFKKTLQDGFRRIETQMGRVVAGLGGSASALATRGFAGTGDGAKLSFAMDRLSSQMAAVFQPLIQAMTYGANRLTNVLARADSRTQNALLYGSLGAGAGYGLNGARGALGLGMVGFGYGMGNPMMAAAGAGIATSGLNPYLRVAAVVAASAAAAPDRYESEARPSDYYSRMRRPVAEGGMGRTRLGAAWATASASVDSLFSSPLPGAPPAPRPRPERREAPLKFQPQEVEAGETAKRIQEAVMMASSTAEGDGGPLKPVVDILIKIFEFIVEKSGGRLERVPEPERGRAW